MPRDLPLIRPRSAVILLGALALCFCAGAWCDLPLSRALYNPWNPFGRVLAAYGQAPGALVASAAGTLLILSHERDRRGRSLALTALGIAAHLAALGYLVVAPARYLELGIAFRGAVALLLLGAVSALAVRLARGVPPRELRRLAGFLLFVVAAENLLVAGLKELWGRPRMRMLAATPQATFQPWWVIGSGQREAPCGARHSRRGVPLLPERAHRKRRLRHGGRRPARRARRSCALARAPVLAERAHPHGGRVLARHHGGALSQRRRRRLHRHLSRDPRGELALLPQPHPGEHGRRPGAGAVTAEVARPARPQAESRPARAMVLCAPRQARHWGRRVSRTLI